MNYNLIVQRDVEQCENHAMYVNESEVLTVRGSSPIFIQEQSSFEGHSSKKVK